MPDKIDVINEANHLLQEAHDHKPMHDVLADYVAYLTANPEVSKNPELSHAMSSRMKSILPDLIVEDVQDANNGGLSATETRDELKALANDGTAYSEMAKLLLDEQYLLQQAGVVSSDGQNFNLALLKIDATNHKFTLNNSSLSEEFLADGTGIWRDATNNVVAAQFDNGMIVHLTGEVQGQLTSRQDILNTSLVATQIDYPNGSRLRKDPAATDPTSGWYFTDTNTNNNYPATQPTWSSRDFSLLDDSYLVSLSEPKNQSVSIEATFDITGNLTTYSKIDFNDSSQTETISSVEGSKQLQLAGGPSYRQVGPNQWEILQDDGQSAPTWQPLKAEDAPKITSINGLLDVRIPAGTGGGGPDQQHLAYYPNGFGYEADYQRTFKGNVQIFDLRGGTTALNMNRIVAVPDVGKVVLPDHSTIQKSDDGSGNWIHYAYSEDPSRPLDKGAVLGTVSQPYYDSQSTTNNDGANVYFLSNDSGLPPVAVANKAGKYTLQVNGALETFNFGGSLAQVVRRDGSVISFSDSNSADHRTHPISISFANVKANADVNKATVTYDESSPTHWTRNGVPVTVEIDNKQSDYATITITQTDANGKISKDVFRDGGLDPVHWQQDVATPPPQSVDTNKELNLGRNKIQFKDGKPVSVTLDDSELSDLLYTPMLSNNGQAVTISIPPPASSDYEIVISDDFSKITVTNKKTGEYERFSAQGVEQYGS